MNNWGIGKWVYGGFRGWGTGGGGVCFRGMMCFVFFAVFCSFCCLFVNCVFIFCVRLLSD